MDENMVYRQEETILAVVGRTITVYRSKEADPFPVAGSQWIDA